MRRYEKEIERARTDRQKTQSAIIKKYGMTKVDEEKKRLCAICVMGGFCILIPITTTGEDCPYFQDLGQEKEE